VDESQRADDDIHRIIGQGQPVKLTDAELAVWDTPPRIGAPPFIEASRGR
jgi:hypothetical protein